jgi:hypothetical protein
VWTGEGEAMIPAPDPPGVHVVTRDGIDFERIDGEAASSVSYVEGIGTVAGTPRGRFFARVPGGWSPLAIDGDGWWGVGIFGYDQGFLFHLASGAAGFFHPDLEVCDEVFMTNVAVESRMVPQGRGVLVSAVASDAKSTFFTRLARR